MRQVFVTSGKELAELVKMYGIIMATNLDEQMYFGKSVIITELHGMTDLSCIFKTLRFDIDEGKVYYGVNTNPDKFSRHVVYIPEVGKRFKPIPCCALGKLEHSLFFSISLNRKLSQEFFSGNLSSTSHNFADIVILVEINKEK